VSKIPARPRHRLRDSASRPCRGRRRVPAVGWRERLESDPRRGRRRRRWATEPQEILSAGTWIWPSINGGGHGRCPRRRQRAAGAHYKGKEADVLVTRIAPGVVLLVAELRAATGAICLERRSAPVSDNAVYPANLCPIQCGGAASHSRPRTIILHNESGQCKRFL
jgi:hypothetical protein